MLNLNRVLHCRTAHGYRPRDSNRQELAASVIERVHNVQASQGHVPWQARRHISDLEQKAAAKGSAKDDSGVQAEAGSVAGSASAAEGPNKRQKVVSGLQDGPAVDEVITAFLTGADALSNTKVSNGVLGGRKDLVVLQPTAGPAPFLKVPSWVTGAAAVLLWHILKVSA